MLDQLMRTDWVVYAKPCEHGRLRAVYPLPPRPATRGPVRLEGG